MSKSARLAEMFEFEDEESQRQALCERCRKFVLMSNIKYVPKGNDSKMALCNKCLKNFTPPPSNLKKGDFEEDNQVKYLCERCSYNFKQKSGSKASLRCPYCGKSDKIIESKSRSVNQLLKDNEFF